MHTHVRLLNVDGCTQGLLFQLTELLQLANEMGAIRAQRSGHRPWQDITWSFVDERSETGLAKTAALSSEALVDPALPAQSISILVVPPFVSGRMPDILRCCAAHPSVIELIRHTYDQGGVIAALGSAMWWLGEAQLLLDEALPVHWMHAPWLRRRHPRARFLTNQNFYTSRHFICGNSLTESLPLQLAVLERLTSTEFARVVSKSVCSDTARNDAVTSLIESQLIDFTGDGCVARATRWMRQNLADPFSITRLARETHCGVRTLSRHFDQQLGKTPLAYLTELRIARSKVLLEITHKGVLEIAADCGYADVRSYRRAFVRLTGQTPSEYRDHHTTRGSRRHWSHEADA